MKRLGLLAMGTIHLTLAGCVTSQKAFLTVQTCLNDSAGVERLSAIMQQQAQQQGLKFIDNSAVTADSLGAKNIVDLHIEGGGGMGVTAANIGLRPYQVALGFTAGSNPSAARRLSKSLLKSISSHWAIDEIPPGKGVFPMESCGKGE